MKNFKLIGFIVLIHFNTICNAQSIVADSLYLKSKRFWYNNVDSAEHYLQLALGVSRNEHYLRGEADALKGLGFLSQSKAKKLNYFFKALAIRQALGDSLGIGVSLYDIGTVYQSIGEHDKMLDYYTRSLQLRKRINDYGGVALCLITFGQIEENKGNFPSGLNLYRESLRYRKLSGEINGIAFAHINMATANLNLSLYDSALYFAHLAEKEFVSVNNKFSLEWTIWVKGKCLFEMHHYDQALQEILTSQSSKDWLSPRTILLLSEIYEAKSDLKEALNFRKRWNEQNEITERERNEHEVRALAADYEFKLREEKALRDNEKEKREKHRQDNLQFLLIAIALIAIFTLLISIRKRVSSRVVNIASFVGFLMLFEFLVVLIDPMLQTLSGNKPLLLLLINVSVALLIAPLHHVVEKFFKHKLMATPVNLE